jgi:HAD superfamily hydrolase (TIGR01509 family)
MIEPYDALIFDCDGTLADTMPAHYVAWKRTMEALGIAFPEDRFYALAGVPAPDIIAMLAGEAGLSVDVERIAHEKETLFHASIPSVLAIDPVVEIVRSNHGILPMAVASGSPRWSVEAIVGQLGLGAMFGVMVCAGEVERPKPAPDVFLACAERLGVDPARCCVYEDSELGLDGARAAGMGAVDVRPWYPARG